VGSLFSIIESGEIRLNNFLDESIWALNEARGNYTPILGY
jgi:hypothetical protein